MVLFKSLVNGKVANGGRENDRGNLGCSAVAYTAKKPFRPLASGAAARRRAPGRARDRRRAPRGATSYIYLYIFTTP